MDAQLNIRIQQYLDKQMSPAERTAFELELKTDPGIKKALLIYALGGGRDLMSEEEKQLRTRLAEDIDDSPPLTEPKIGWRFHLLNFWYSAWRNWTIWGIVAVLAFFVVRLMMPLTPISRWIGEMAMQEPRCAGVADASDVARTIFEKASTIYCSGTVNVPLAALQTLEDSCQVEFCMSRYYLAHIQLKEKKYSAAVQSFEECLAAYDVEINEYTETRGCKGELTYNWILARLGAGEKPAQVASVLEPLLQSETNPNLLEKINDLQKKLKSYL